MTTKDLTCTGLANINDISANNATIDSLTVLNGTALFPNVQINESLTVGHHLTVNKNTSMDQDLLVSGQTTLQDVSCNTLQCNTIDIAGGVDFHDISCNDILCNDLSANGLSVSGKSTLHTTENHGYMYFNNTGTANVIDYGTQYFGAIGANTTSGDAEVDFINMGFNASMLTKSAFDWYLMTSATAKTMLARLYNSGDMFIKGVLSASGLSTTTLVASGHSQLADVSSNSVTVNGDLHVTGEIFGLPVQNNMEILYYHLTGSTDAVTALMTLQNNTSNTKNYIVIPGIYYGLSVGTAGTYDANATSGALHNIVISDIETSTFRWYLSKSNNNNVNVYIYFMVLYGVSDSSFPKGY